MPNSYDDFHETLPHGQDATPEREVTFAESIEDEGMLLSSEDMLAEMSEDISLGEVEGLPPLDKTKRRPGPILSKQQQMQVAIWIVEGYKWKQMVPVMEKHWGFAVVEGTWRYYRAFRKDLQRDAAGYLEDQYLKQGFATRAVRVKKLGQMLERVENYMDIHGLEEMDAHVAGFGKGQTTVKTVKFASTLIREYREGLNLMNKWLEPVERAVKGQNDQRVISVDKETSDQFLLASGWNPGGSGSKEGAS